MVIAVEFMTPSNLNLFSDPIPYRLSFQVPNYEREVLEDDPPEIGGGEGPRARRRSKRGLGEGGRALVSSSKGTLCPSPADRQRAAAATTRHCLDIRRLPEQVRPWGENNPAHCLCPPLTILPPLPN
jgi:hypothetical protein